jgi:cell division GTPase FtsZ
MSVSDYTCKLGIMYLGGMGGNVKRGFIDIGETPARFPEYFAFVGNTDRRVLKRDFSDPNDTRLQPWIDPNSGQLTLCRFGEITGGKDITEGRGAGGDPVVGRRAAETERSIQQMTAFLKKVDEVFLVGAVGGGTGTGALPVAARLCKELGKPTLAFVVMPEPEEGLDDYALPALQEIRSLVTTTAIQNAYLLKALDSLSPDQKEALTTREMWSELNKKTLHRWIKVFREIVQETGLEEFDEADWKMILNKGNYFYFGLSEVAPDKMKETMSEKIVAELFSAEFLDQSVAERGEIVGLWFHGKWPDQKVRQIRNQVKERMAKTSPVHRDKLQVHRGIFDTPQDADLWVAMFVTAKEPQLEKVAQRMTQETPSANLEEAREGIQSASEPPPTHEQNGTYVLSEEKAQEGLEPFFGFKLPSFTLGRASNRFGEVSYLHNGQVVTFEAIPVELVKRFKALVNNPINFSSDDIKRICDEIEERTQKTMDVRPGAQQTVVAH